MATHARRKIHARKSTLPPLPSLEAPPDIRIANRSAMKGEWTDPDDTTPNAARTARMIQGYHAFCPLRWCIRRHGARSSYTVEHVEAAERLRTAFDGARLGFSGLKDWRPANAAVYRPSKGPTAPALQQLRCRAQFDRAWSLFNATQRAMLSLTLLHNVAVGRAAELLDATKPLMTQRMVKTLDRLSEHFDIHERGAA
jgi:hypothetical protein